MIDTNLIYLDNAATTFPKPGGVVEAMLSEYRRLGVSPGRGSYDLATETEMYIKEVRLKIARLFGAPDPSRVIFTANATDSLNQAILGLLQPGDHVITTRLEHNSVLRPLHHLMQQEKITCSLVPFNSAGFISPEDIITALQPQTRLIIVTHASNVLGTIQPVEEVGAICVERGIPLMVDASQSAGQVEVNMSSLGASAIAFTGHKSLYGPMGIGGLVLHPDLEINPTRFGGTGVESESPIHTWRYPHRLEAGTPNLPGIIGLSHGIDYLLKAGMQTMHEREMELFSRLCQGLQHFDGVDLYGAGHMVKQLPLLSLNIRNMTPEDVGAILDADFNIAVRAGLHCAPLVHDSLGTAGRGAVRFSLGHFNTARDIDRVIEAVEQITAMCC